ncbi:MAG: hypothetical protein GX787_06165 [Tissierellia bacterium]|nr:hypothetical protein [Tissierellia bacterium]
MFLNATADINTQISLANSTKNLVNPEVFYSKQLLDTIRIDAANYVYYRLADESPIQNQADKLTLRRWAPLQAHTTPIVEGVPPVSDKGSVEKYELEANQYGRYMEFSDKIDFTVVDPVAAHYTKEYALVAMETLDLLAQEVLFSVAQKFYAGQAANFEALTLSSIPTLTDLRLIVLSLKKGLVKPRSNGRYHVIGSPEFYFDMISDPVVEKYMTINQTTKTMYEDTKLVPLFDMEFYETFCVPTNGDFMKDNASDVTELHKRIVKVDTVGTGYEYASIDETTYASEAAGYVKDSRTGQDASYIPELVSWNFKPAGETDYSAYTEFKAQHILVVGKDALTRTGLAGEGNARVYVKAKGSAGVLDPIDQRQSIGFKINSVGFGSTRLEAIVDYVCVPSQVNAV